MAEEGILAPVKRERRRARQSILTREKRQEIFDRVHAFYSEDLGARSEERELRLQRYAKFRQWSEGKDWPWPGSSDIALPDMMEKSLRIQDTLHNAVMSQMPPVRSRANKSVDKGKENTVDQLIRHQVFVEQPGEDIVGELADDFANNGLCVAFIPWVKERREMQETKRFEPIPPDMLPYEYFDSLVRREFGGAAALPKGEGWDWDIAPAVGEKFEAKFYTVENGVEMVTEREVTVYDGPRVIVKDYDDVLYPVRAKNLQIPGPSNPGGAPHVILMDYPTIDEVKRLAKKKPGEATYYDLMDAEDAAALDGFTASGENDAEKDQKDALQGVQNQAAGKAREHNTITRLLCFDLYDIDGDGIAEDVVWWVLLEPRLVVRARLLTEMFPSNPPRRPLAAGSFLPVKGRLAGISVLEMIEGLHDAMKQLLDQTIDGGLLKNMPWGAYRPTSSVKPTTIRLWPGELYPLNDPQRDLFIPSFGNADQTFGLNMYTLLSQLEDKVTTIGDFQLGRVPAGRSSALRTLGGMAMLAGQGEARPERILRRFFMCLTEIWAQIHELNQHFLPKDKQVRIVGMMQRFQDPYMTIKTPAEIAGRYTFGFDANAFNTSKQMLQEALAQVGQAMISPLMIQLGITDAEVIYKWARDFIAAWGQDANQYAKQPSPDAMKPRIFAEDAIGAIVAGTIPDGRPMEPGGWAEFLQKLVAFQESDNFGFLSTPQQLDIWRGYLAEVQQKAEEEARMQQLLAAAQAFQVGAQDRGGRPAEQMPMQGQNPPLEEGETMDETMPGAKGAVQ